MLCVGPYVRASSKIASYGRLLARSCDVRNNPASGAKACMHARTLNTHTLIYIHTQTNFRHYLPQEGGKQWAFGWRFDTAQCVPAVGQRANYICVRLFTGHQFSFFVLACVSF